MFGNKKLVLRNEELESEILKLKEEVAALKLSAKDEKTIHQQKIAELNNAISEMKKFESYKLESAINEVKKKLSEDAFKSDCLRIKAESALEAYEKMDTKTDREELRKLLQSAVSGLVEGVKSKSVEINQNSKT